LTFSARDAPNANTSEHNSQPAPARRSGRAPPAGHVSGDGVRPGSDGHPSKHRGPPARRSTIGRPQRFL